MKKRTSMAALFLFVMLACLGCSRTPDPGPSPLIAEAHGIDLAPVAANVILVSVDTLRADHLGCYGYPVNTSPAIDRFCRDAVRFEQAIAQAPSTLPSHASLFSSLLPSHHGASFSLETPLPDDVRTIAEVLSDAGYATAAFTGGGQLSQRFGVAQGFEVYREIVDDDTLSTVLSPALRWIERVRDRPFFLFLHAYEVHHPYTPDADFLWAMETSYGGELPPEISIDLIERINSGELAIDGGDLRHIIACYDAEIRSVDETIGRLLSWLQVTALYDDTILVFTSDHGEELGEHGIVGWHSHTLHDELLMVPLVIKFPARWSAGRTVSEQARLIDVAPTIAATVGLAGRGRFTGIDLRRQLTEAPPLKLTAVSELDSDHGYIYSSLRSADWKLYPRMIFDRQPFSGETLTHRARIRITSLVQPYCLFDLNVDPGERIDVGRSRRQTRNLMRSDLEDRLASGRRHESSPTSLDEQTRDRLRSLGYVD